MLHVPVRCMIRGVEIPTRIFVGNLPYDTNEIELKNFFSSYGTIIEVKIITDRNGVSKGYGFVTFRTKEEAKAILSMGTMTFGTKEINIAKAIRKQGGQYEKPNEEYISGMRKVAVVQHCNGGHYLAYDDGNWEPLANHSQPAKPFLVPMPPQPHHGIKPTSINSSPPIPVIISPPPAPISCTPITRSPTFIQSTSYCPEPFHNESLLLADNFGMSYFLHPTFIPQRLNRTHPPALEHE